MSDSQTHMVIDPSPSHSNVDNETFSFKPVHIQGKWADVNDDDDF